jgi:hypothetical protein
LSSYESSIRRITVIKRISPIFLLLALVPLQLFGQQTGASITGHVLDPSGAAVSGAAIKLTSTTTGSVYTAGSDSSGIYQLPFVPVGDYTLSIAKAGFKKYEQAGIVLLANMKDVVDVTMQLGTTTQTVNVTANAPILNLESGDRTTTVSNTRLDPEVFRGQNTIVTTFLIPGVTQASGDQKLRPWDNGGTQSTVINGGQAAGSQGGSPEQGQSSGNQVMVNGISINRGGQGTGYNAMASAVDEVAVQTTMYDAQYGWSTGGHIDTIVKSGSNQWHGHAYDYLQNTLLNAEDWGSQSTHSGRQPWHFNYFGGEVGGPIKKNKIFVFYAYQLMWSIQKDPFTNQVPTAAERQGNFQGVCSNSSGNCNQIQLFDPATTATTNSITDPTSCYYTAGGTISSGTNPCRSNNTAVIANNVILAPINPIAKNVMNIIPLPALNGVTVPCGGVVSGQAGGLCGSFAGNIANNAASRKFVDYFPEHLGRIDWNFTDSTHAYFVFGKNDLAETRSYVYSTVSAINLAETSGNNPLFRGNQFYDLQITHTFNPTTVLSLRTGMDRYPSGGGDITIAQTDPTSLGFSSTWRSLAGHYFPQIQIQNMAGAGGTLPSYDASDIWSHEAVLAHTHGPHNIRVGWQRFDLAEYNESPGAINGTFNFNGYFTSQNPTGPIGNTGYGLADFELGYPVSGSINQPAYPEYWMHEESLFVQDDYHVSRKFTLNLGLRWDYAGPVHDDHDNRLLNGFCFTCANPLQVSGLTLLGGPTYAGVGGGSTGMTNRKFDNIGPRVGFAYDIGHDTVIRGGWGIIYAQQLEQPGAAPGFTQTTSMVSVPGAAGIFNPNITFANPIQTGLLPIVGSGYGLATNIGQGISFVDPNTDLPRTQQYSLEVQHRIGKDWMISVAYVGTKATRLDINTNLNYLPLADLPLTPSDQNNVSAPGGGGAATVSYLNAQVPNPFQSAMANYPQYATLTKGTFLNNATVARSQLLLPYPQFTGVSEQYNPVGRSHYDALQIEVNKRISHNLEFNSSFTWSQQLQALAFLNPQDAIPQQTLAPYDMPRQVKVNFIYFAPFGPGQKFLATANPVVSRLVSGWSLSATPEISDGVPAIVPSGLQPIGNPVTANRTLSHAFNTCYTDLNGATHDCSIDSTPAWRQTQPNQLYEWNPAMHGVRYWGMHRLDASIMKKTTIKERFQLIYRADFINAFNSSEWNFNMNNNYTSGAFGYIGPPQSDPSDDPRVIQMSLQLKF